MARRRTRHRRRGKPSPPPAPTTPTALAPETQPADPGQSGPRILYLPQKVAGVRVTEDTALTCAAVWACVRAISEDLAALPCRAYSYRPGGGRDLLAGSTVDWLLHTQSNPETVAFSLRETLLAHALTWGNGYAEIERDGAGRPVWLWQLTPDRVCPDRDSRGKLYYDVRNDSGPNTVLMPEDVLHVKGLGYDGLIGYSVIRMAAKSIGANMATTQSAASYFENDSTPGGLLKHPGKLSPEAQKNIRESWNRRHGGPNNRRHVAILEEGMEWTQTSLPPEDSQLIEIMQFGPSEICRWFRVPPHKIADLLRATFSNIEEQEIAYVIDCLMPWAVRVEQEINAKLFRGDRQGSRFVKHNFSGRLRGNVAARTAMYTQLLDRGVFSINDVLELEDRNPIGSDGDKRFVQQNMQLLEKAGEEPPPGQGAAAAAPAPVEEPEEPEPESETEPEESGDLSARVDMLQPVLEDALQRVFRREEHRIRDALARLGDDGEKLSSWMERFEREHRDYLLGALSPSVTVLTRMAGGGVAIAQTVLTLYAEAHLVRLRGLVTGAKGDSGLSDLSGGWLPAACELRDRVLAACAASAVPSATAERSMNATA